MIALDTSALITIGLREPGWEPLFKVLTGERELVISAATVAETLIVASFRRVHQIMPDFLATLALQVVELDDAGAHRVGAIYARWGKGMHPASLNYGDCFAYDVAKEHDCPLLFIGNDFAQTDIRRAV